jgi:phage FluMu protein gp41
MLTLWIDYLNHRIIGIRLYDKWIKAVPLVYEGPMTTKNIGLHSHTDKIRIIEAAERLDESFLMSLV